MPLSPALPNEPPIEIAKQGRVWLVEAYQRGEAGGETYSTHDSQIEAVRAAKTKMEADHHPCTLRWDAPRSIGNLYWNPLFECLKVQYDELLDAWTVVPEQGTCAIAICESRHEACTQAKRIQHEYNFKHLQAYDASAEQFEERDHRFLRHDLTSSGVRFDPSALEGPPETVADEAESTDDVEDEETYVSPASPGQLGASIPDVTKVTFVDTDGILHRYATPWGDGTDAEILAVSRKHADDTHLRDLFETWLSRWREADDDPCVATVYESGTDPVPWVAHQASETTLAATGLDLPVETRISAVEQASRAVDTMTEVSSGPVCGVHPERIYVHTSGTDERVSVARWGTEWAIQRTVGTHHPTPYTAPEQLDETLTATTPVYQLGALAYWLLCESPPITAVTNRTAAVRTGDIPPAAPVTRIPDEAGPVIDRALATAPGDRYESVQRFRYELLNVL